jgi:hypothetical protein
VLTEKEAEYVNAREAPRLLSVTRKPPVKPVRARKELKSA